MKHYRTVQIRALAAVLAMTLLAACVPPPASSPQSNLTLEMRRMQADVSRQEQVLQDLQRRISTAEEKLEGQEAELAKLRMQRTPLEAAAPLATSYKTPGAETAEQFPASAGGTPTEVYLQAFGNYASGRYEVAIQGFKTFLQRFPNNSYASNAQYWLADCYFNQQQYQLALQEFQKVLDDYSRAPKSPDALLRMATAHIQLGNLEQAEQEISSLKRRFPDSAAAQKADELTRP